MSAVSLFLATSSQLNVASLRQHKVAYMKVTLSRKELPGLVPAGATYVSVTVVESF